MTSSEWEGLVLQATQRADRVVARIALGPRRTETIGRGAAGDMTSVADKAAEDVLIKALQQAGAEVLSEEAGLVARRGATALAIIDPLDGSANFERGIPFYCTSVAIVEDGEVILGVVRDLVSGDTYTARKGGGARLNRRPIHCNSEVKLVDAVVGLDLSGIGSDKASVISPLVFASGRIVHYGANALELCYLARGLVDAFVDVREKMRVTDLAAATLIAVEAGAVISGPNGRRLKLQFNLKSRYSLVAAASPRLHSLILGNIGDSPKAPTLIP